MYDQIKNWLNATNTLEELGQYISLKSRSNRKEEVKECAKFSKALLERLDMEVKLFDTSGNQIIVGTKSGSGTFPKILLYGHYDVQPEGNEDLWDTPPFKAVIKDGKVFGRGSADNKGQHFAHIKALEFIKSHYPERYEELDLIFLLDGDEERGSFSLTEVFADRSEMFDADLLIVSDGPSLVSDRPSIIGGVRGILTFQITIQSNNSDLHSGNFGGMARSANLDMLNLLRSMLGKNGEVKIPGFYDNVVEPTDKRRELLDKLKPIFDDIQKDMKYARAKTLIGSTIYDQNQFLPTMNINGISSGGVKKERRTIIPAESVVSIDCRLVPNMNSKRIQEIISEYIVHWAQDEGIEEFVDVEFEHAMEASMNSFQSHFVGQLKNAFSYGFGEEPLIVPTLGGSLPLYLFSQYLNKEVFLIPFALPDENNHAPNENLDIEYFEKGICSMVKLYLDLVEN